MIQPPDQHLDDIEIDAFVSSSELESDEAKANEPILQRVRQHIEGCEDCKRKVLIHQAVQKEITQSGSIKKMPPGPDCEIDTDWIEVVAGLYSESKMTALINHASQCGYCGPRLKKAAETMSDEAAPAEIEVLSQLQNAQPGWSSRMVQTMKRQGQPEPRPMGWGRYLRFPKLAFAGVASAMIALAGWLALVIFRPIPVEQLLAQAYTEQRTIELRIPGAKYGPTRIARGREHSSLNRPTSLMDAESIIGHRLTEHPNDPEWLDKKGRAELLDGNYNSAITTLLRASDLSADPAIITDLATAHFERAEAEGVQEEYQNALKLLNEALEQAPNDRMALFNRAIVEERIGLVEAAIKDWEQYLSFGGSDDWKDEARRYLVKLQEKVKKSYQNDQPLMDFNTFGHTVFVKDDTTWQSTDNRIEDYLDQAVIIWLPRAFSLQSGPKQKDALQALQILAAILVERHDDYWLRSFLEAPRSPLTAEAVLAMGEALKQEAASDPEKAAEQARKAEALFRKVGNKAGIHRAEAELVYALHRSVQGSRCEAAAEQLERDIDPNSSPWLAAQVLIEHSICAGMVEHLAKSGEKISRAMAVAKRAGYEQLYLRALGIAASLDTEMGRPDAAWAKDRTGLAIYWNGSYAPQRAYQFYSDMGFFPEKSGNWWLALALARAADTAAIRTKVPATEALAHFRLASATAAAGSRAEAIQAFEAAAKIYETLPKNKTTKAYLLDGQISLAELKILNGEDGVPIADLTAAESKLKDISDYSIPLRLYAVLGEMYSQQKRWDDATAAYTKAILVAENALGGLEKEAERQRWERETQRAYHGLLKSYLQQGGSAAGGLEFWEWYKVAASRPAVLKKIQLSSRDALLVNPADPERVHALDSVRQALKKEAIIAYAQLPDEIISWTFDDRGVKLTRVPISAAEFELTATRFLHQCSDPESSIEALRANGRKLYDWLIASQIQGLNVDDQLTIEPDGEIAKVPFAALVDENGKYLAERSAIAFSPGAYYRSANPMGQTLSPAYRAVIVAPPALTSETGLKPLPESLQEVNTVADRFYHAVRLTGAAATIEAVERSLSNADVFHYVGHAYGNSGSIGLLMAGTPGQAAADRQPAVLAAEDISRLKFRHMRLVVLSSCSTENDPEQVLTDPNELVRTFLQAGASQVIASRWNVDSATAKLFTNEVYKRIFSGSHPVDALRLAAMQPRKEAATMHPYFWASFCVFKN